MTLGAVLLGYKAADVKPGWIAFFVVMTLLVATFLLWRNMNKQLRKIDVPSRAEFRRDAAGPPGDPAPDSIGDRGEDDSAPDR